MRNLFGEILQKRQRGKGGGGKHSSKEPEILGCEGCPLNRVKGIIKVKNLDKIAGRKRMLWAQCPGAEENRTGKELVGRAGQLLWEVLKEFGLERKHFDIQNVTRCRPTNPDGSNRDPDKKELRCCSIYNEEALERNRHQAQVHLILGKIAGVQLLGRKYRKDTPLVWHPEWEAYCILADHPSYVLRLGGKRAGWAYFSFRDRIKAVKAVSSYPGRWGYVLSRNYGKVITPDGLRRLRDEIYHQASIGTRIDVDDQKVPGRRVGVDIEDGLVDGENRILMIGFGMGGYPSKDWDSWQGKARSVVLFHPEVSQSPKRIDPMVEILREMLEDSAIRKALHHGSYDILKLQRLLGIHVRGYDFDSQYGAYLKYPHLRTYSLASLCNFFFQEFGDYKDMVSEWSGNFALAPLSRLVPYNCADADLSKRLEVKTAPNISMPLLQVYIQDAFTLDAMEKRGPILDRENLERLKAILPGELERLRKQLRHIAGDSQFNPDAPTQVAKLLFDRLGLSMLAGRSTSKEVLETLAQQSKSPVPGMVLQYRKFSKMNSTYVVGYERSADLHEGELRTIWWLTGAVTGRLRSGKGDSAEAQGVINFQNLHGNPILQNLLVSDVNWRRVLAP